MSKTKRARRYIGKMIKTRWFGRNFLVADVVLMPTHATQSSDSVYHPNNDRLYTLAFRDHDGHYEHVNSRVRYEVVSNDVIATTERDDRFLLNQNVQRALGLLQRMEADHAALAAMPPEVQVQLDELLCHSKRK